MKYLFVISYILVLTYISLREMKYLFLKNMHFTQMYQFSSVAQ